MVIKNIIKSQTEPPTNCLWLKDNSLYYHNNGNWENVDLNTVYGIQKLEEDVSEIQNNILKIERDYIGVFDELNNMKEVISSVQSGECSDLLARLGYDEDDIEDFNDCRLRGYINVSYNDVLRSVQLWENIHSIIHQSIIDIGCIDPTVFESLVIAPKFWDEERDKSGWQHEYTDEQGRTTSLVINTSMFISIISNCEYIPLLVISGTGGNPQAIAIKDLKVGNLNTTLQFKVKRIKNLEYINNNYSSLELSNLRNIGSCTLGSPEVLAYCPGMFRYSYADLNLDCSYVSKCNDMFAHLGGGFNHYKDVSVNLDLRKIPENVLTAVPDSTVSQNQIFLQSNIKNSVIKITTSDVPQPSGSGLKDGGVFSSTFIKDNNEIYVEHHQFYNTAHPLFQSILGRPSFYQGPSIGFLTNNNNNIHISGLKSVKLEGCDLIDFTLHVPDLKTIDYTLMTQTQPCLWLKELNDVESDIDIDRTVDNSYFNPNRFQECVDTWGVQTNPVNVILSQSQYNILSYSTKSDLIEKNFNIVVNN